ncbi:MAG TPA: phosphatidate cytidylyltransferase [bacterium]|nr:phosphatidate cytidylyltransferase [bacterium]
MLIPRLISSIFLTILFFCTVWFSQTQVVFFLIVINTFIALGMYEVLALAEKKGIPVFKVYVIFSGMALLTTIFACVHQNLQSGDLAACVMFILFFGLFILYSRMSDLSGAVSGISASIGTVFYVSWLFSFLVRINFMEGVDGRMYIFFLALMVFLADIMAYTVGNLIGRHKLAPVISPKKTVEGAFGAVGGALIGAALGKVFLVHAIAWHHIVSIGLLVGIISQIGDLFESILKRDAGVKDSGKIIPGMGGVLDLVDGLLFCAPVIYLYLQVFVR